jgi:hypothetical protein
MRPELVADAFEFLLRISIEEGIATLIGVAGLILLRIPALEGLEVLPNVILPGRRVGIHPERFLRTI